MNLKEATVILSKALGRDLKEGDLVVGPGLFPPYFASPIHALYEPMFDDEAGCGIGVGSTESEALLDLLHSLSKTYTAQAREHLDQADAYRVQVDRELQWSSECQDTSDKILSLLATPTT